MDKKRVKFGHEVFFESCIVGCDDRGVVYIRTTGLDGAVQLVRIKPSEFVAVAMHISSRVTKPHQGITPKNRKEFVPLNERLTRPNWEEDAEDEEEMEETPVQIVPPETEFRQRRRVTTVAIIDTPQTLSPPPQYRVRRRCPEPA